MKHAYIDYGGRRYSIMYFAENGVVFIQSIHHNDIDVIHKLNDGEYNEIEIKLEKQEYGAI